MQNHRQRGWQHLTDKEQMALSLTIVSERSQKEAAIIMNLSPYKFNEIYLRAKYFFSLFSDHYEKYDDLFPQTEVDKIFKTFINLLIKYRKKPNLVFYAPEFFNIVENRVRGKLWRELLGILILSDREAEKAFLYLLREFDRWNNFRILPKDYQQPAAFPRRRNREFKRIKDTLITISDIGWDLIRQYYAITQPPFMYVPFIKWNDFGVIRVKKSQGISNYFSRNKIPIFPTEQETFELAELVFDYEQLKKKSPYSAKKFWAGFRLKIIKAENYKDLLNVQRVDTKEISVRDRQFINSIGRTKKQIRRGTDGSEFWKH